MADTINAPSDEGEIHVVGQDVNNIKAEVVTVRHGTAGDVTAQEVLNFTGRGRKR